MACYLLSLLTFAFLESYPQKHTNHHAYTGGTQHASNKHHHTRKSTSCIFGLARVSGLVMQSSRHNWSYRIMGVTSYYGNGVESTDQPQLRYLSIAPSLPAPHWLVVHCLIMFVVNEATIIINEIRIHTATSNICTG